MAYVQNFANDVFISFSHVDDREGWVRDFTTRLEDRLAQIGATVTIWRDGSLRKTDVFSDEIFDQLKNTALLISIISPTSILSNWCQDERQKFEQFAETNGGFRIGNAFRAIKVTKTPLEKDAHRSIMGTLGFEFYERDRESAVFREFDFASKEFKDRLTELALDIKRILDEINANHSPTKGPAVYIATTTSDLSEQRQAIVREVQAWGYQVYPSAELPTESAAYRSAVDAALAECVLSVHLLSEKRGLVLEGEEASVIAIQYELANARKMDRMSWVPPGTHPHESISTYLEQNLGEGLTMLEGRSIEDLKDEIEAKLKHLRGEVALVDKVGKRNLYLVCDRKDHPYAESSSNQENILKLISYLDSKGFVVWLPPVNITEKRQRNKDHRDTLKLSDAVMLYWGSSDEGWFRENLRELSKAQSKRSTRRSLATGIYFSPPPVREKTQYRHHLDLAIEQYGGFDPAVLNPLLERLETDETSDDRG